ncbi:MAG: PP2C family protein-serine/threonine phosphatase [Deltaproteobacteria bacterium]
MIRDAVVVDVSQDWAMACTVQERFMQGVGRVPHTLDYSARCKQVYALGGDCYDFTLLSNDRLAMTLGDASGKSLGGALMIANVQSSLRTAALFAGNDLATVMQGVNRQVHASSLPNQYATLFYAVFDGPTRRLQYVNAGHNPPLVIHKDGSFMLLETGGPPVGVFEAAKYEVGTVQLRPGDILVGYSDGVVESENPAEEFWGLNGLQNAVAGSGMECAASIVDSIFKSMDEYSKGRMADDATVAVLKTL